MREVNQYLRPFDQLLEGFLVFQAADDVVHILERLQMVDDAVFSNESFDAIGASVCIGLGQ